MLGFRFSGEDACIEKTQILICGMVDDAGNTIITIGGV